MDSVDYRQKLTEAAGTIRRLSDQLAGERRRASEPIAVIGMGLRMPGGAHTPEEFWSLLREGVDTTREFPAERGGADAYHDPDPESPGKAYVIRGGFLDSVDGFEPAMFGISPREAVGMDPQQRIVLEVVWEALERAGYAPTSLRDTRTGVYFGVSTTDYARMRQEVGDIQDVDAYQLTGEPSFIAGRVSYTLGLRGPSSVIDTTCSSSLVAVHEASQALRAGECDLALAGGVNLMLSPYGFVLMSKFRALAPDGRCKTFDAAADGYARGEGAGTLVLKRVSDAIRDGDTVLAVIRGSATNHDGRSSGLTVPNPQAQQDVIRRAVEQAGIAPAEVGYVEAHGTGTALGDPIELRALHAALRSGTGTGTGQASNEAEPLLVGSVKTNIGHLEAAAGIAGLIKVILSLRHAQVPPHLNLTTPNPNVPWNRISVRVPTSLRPWPATHGPRTAGVSGFGASGTNAHIVLSTLPAAEEAPTDASGTGDGRAEVLVLSARTPGALRTLAGDYAGHLRSSEHRLADICFTSQTGRARLAHGLAVAGASSRELADLLARYARGEEQLPLAEAELAPYQGRKLAWLLPGQGAQYAGMARGLLGLPPFADAFRECAALLDPLLPVPLADVLWNGQGDLDNTRYTQPALFAVEYATGRALLAYGVRPAAMLGHSVGELAAACLASAVDLPDAARLVAHRARLMAELPSGGTMVAVTCGEEAALAAISAAGDGVVTVAAVNGQEDIVLSGPDGAVSAVAAQLAERGYRTRALRVSHAFHSSLLTPMTEEFAALLAGMTFRAPEIPVISNVTGEPWTPAELEPAYWVRHALSTVRFHAGLLSLREAGIRTFVEVGPQPVLAGLGRKALGDDGYLWAGALREGRDDQVQFARTLGVLHARGCDVDWTAVHQGRGPRRVPGPTYPWERERFWFRPALTGASRDARVRSAEPIFEELIAAGTAATTPADALARLVERAVRAATEAHGGRWRALSMARAEGSWLHEAHGPWLVQSAVNPFRGKDFVVDLTGISPEAAEAGGPWTAHGTVCVSRGTPTPVNGANGRREDGDPAAAWGAAITAAVNAAITSFAGTDHGDSGAHWVPALSEAACSDPSRVRSAQVTRPDDGGGEDGGAEVSLLDADGRAIGFVRGLRVEPVPDPAPSRWYPEADVLRTLAWIPAGPATGDRNPGERAVLIGDDPLTAELRGVLRSYGVPAETGACGDAGAVDSLLATNPTVVLVSAAGIGTREVTADLLEGPVFDLEQDVVRLIQRIHHRAERGLDAPRLVIVTQGAVSAGPRQRMHHPAASTLWGLGRVIALEHPRHWGGLIDLDPDCADGTDSTDGTGDLAETARAVAHIVLHPTAEDQHALRGPRVLVPRLREGAPARLPAPARGRLHRPGTVLITGGFGGIGLAVAEWLARSGTQRLVLAGRTALPEPGAWDDPELPAATRTRIDAVRALMALGAEVETVALDVTSEAEVGALVARLKAGPWPLRGVFHAAGVSGPQDLRDVDADAYRRVRSAKTAGAWLLHSATRDLDLDLFVCFSSIAATWGSQHLASYSAANMFLDALAFHRRALGLPALTVDWGPWGQHSHLFESDIMSFLTSLGLRQLAPSQCLSLLGRMLRADAPRQIVCAADWPRYRAIIESRSVRPVFAEVADEDDGAGAGAGRDQELLGRLAGCDPAAGEGMAARRGLLAGFVRAGVAGALSVGQDTIVDDTDLFTLGLDSLMVMEIAARCRRGLGVTVRPKEFFARSTLAEWAAYLDQVLLGTAEESSGGRPEEINAGDLGEPRELPAAIAPRAMLDPAIRPADGQPGTGPSPVGQPERVLLTGATGFVGAYLLDELLASTSAHVECLVRCASPDDGLRRVRETVRKYLPWRADADERVSVLPGDLAKPGLGLSPSAFAGLAERADTIFNAGAWVDFVHTFDQVAPANIGGTQEILRLACTGRPKQTGHVSTYGIWGIPADGRTTIMEDADILSAGRLVTGYVQTKWGAEYLMRQAADRGLPGRVFRLGRILGDSRTGACLTTHFTCRVIKGCIQLGLAPDLGDLQIEMTPVDYVVRAMVRLSDPSAPAGVFHLVNPHKMRFGNLVRFIQERGWPVEVVDRAKWWDALSVAQEEASNALHPVMDIVREFVVGGEEAIDYDVSRADAALAGTGIDCPPLDNSLLETYFDYFTESGYLSPGEGPRTGA